MQYLVKWRGLGYDECTWESLGDLLPQFKPELSRFESQQPIANELIERQKSRTQVYEVALAGGPEALSHVLSEIYVCVLLWHPAIVSYTCATRQNCQ